MEAAAGFENPREGPRISPLGAGELVLVCREPTGLTQERLAARVRTSQSALARIETGNALPTVRTLLRVADAAGFELVVGLRRPHAPSAHPDALDAMGFALLGTLRRSPDDDLADFVPIRMPHPWEGPPSHPGFG
jgi:transcriptional regulator with XRE-family HTH domain